MTDGSSCGRVGLLLTDINDAKTNLVIINAVRIFSENPHDKIQTCGSRE